MFSYLVYCTWGVSPNIHSNWKEDEMEKSTYWIRLYYDGLPYCDFLMSETMMSFVLCETCNRKLWSLTSGKVSWPISRRVYRRFWHSYLFSDSEDHNPLHFRGPKLSKTLQYARWKPQSCWRSTHTWFGQENMDVYLRLGFFILPFRGEVFLILRCDVNDTISDWYWERWSIVSRLADPSLSVFRICTTISHRQESLTRKLPRRSRSNENSHLEILTLEARLAQEPDKAIKKHSYISRPQILPSNKTQPCLARIIWVTWEPYNCFSLGTPSGESVQLFANCQTQS